MGGKKEWPDLGHTGRRGDWGWYADVQQLLPISDSLHTLNAKFGLYEPSRYDMAIPEVASLYETILAGGCPQRLIVRANGYLPKSHPVYDWLRATFPKGSKDPYDGAPQPALEILEGSTRHFLLLKANAERVSQGLPAHVVTFDFRKNISDEMARELFRKANDDRQQNSWLQNLALYRSYRKDSADLSAVANRMRQPLKMIQTFAIFDDCEDCVPRAFADGKITESRAKEIVKLPRGEQAAAIELKSRGTKTATGTVSPVKMVALSRAIEKFGLHGFVTKDRKGDDTTKKLGVYDSDEVAALLRRLGGDVGALKPYPNLEMALGPVLAMSLKDLNATYPVPDDERFVKPEVVEEP
jgi:hypothetical protein